MPDEAVNFSLYQRAASHNLDIVRDCAELASNFPENVHFKFVYWRHGTAEDRNDEAFFDPLIPHLVNSSVIAIEDCWRESDLPSEDSWSSYDANNRLALGLATIDDIEPEELNYWATVIGEKLAPHLIRRGRSMPLFMPVDAYNKTLDDSLPAKASTLDGLEVYIKKDAALNRAREALAIRQLHSYARGAPDALEHIEFDVIYGSAHSFISVAMRALGANVSRVFVDSPVHSLGPLDTVQRMYRFGDNSVFDSPEQLESLETVVVVSAMIERLAAMFEDAGDTLVDNKNFNYCAAVGNLMCKITGGHISKRITQKASNIIFAKLAPYFDQDKTPDTRERESIKEALIALARLAVKR